MMGERTHTMSYLRTNFDSLLESNVREYTADEVAEMTTEQFDALPLSDQISIFHNHRDAYNRLTGRITKDNDSIGKGSKGEAKEAIDEFESRWQAYMDAITAHNA